MKSRPLHSILRPANSFFLKILMAITFIMLSGAISYAATHTWVVSTGGLWTTTANWSPATLPVAGDDIVINGDQTAPITGVPTLNINSLSVNGNCTLSGNGVSATLTVGGSAGTDFIVSIGKTLIISNNLNIILAANSTSTIDGSLTVDNSSTFNTNGTGVTTTVNGTIMANGNVICSDVSRLVFQNGSIYNHAMDGGTVPSAAWADGSTCLITGVVATPPAALSLGQNFFNLTWNNTGQTWNPTAGSTTAGSEYKIRGTFTFISSGTGSNVWPSLNCTVANYVHTGGIDRLSYSDPVTHAIGNFSVTGGTVDLTKSIATAILNITGNISVSGGVLTLSGTGNAAINFTGTDIQTFTSGGTISGQLSWVISNGSSVDFGTSVLSGSASSSFLVSDGGSVITDNASGLTLTGATGSVQVGGTRTYNTGANYIFNGSVNQETGNGVTGAAILTINNTAGITLSRNVAVSSVLNFISGIITTGANTLSLGLTATVSGADLGNYVSGNLLRNIDTGPQIITFDIGDAAKYTPVTIVFNDVTSAGTLTGRSTGSTHPNLAGAPVSSTKYVKRYYTFTNGGIVFSTANVTLNWSISDIQGFANYTKFIVAVYNSGWTTPAFSGRASNSIQATNITAFGDFQVGETSCLEPSITGGPVSQSVTYGENALFRVTATGTGLTYKWQVDSGTGFANISDGGIYSNSTTVVLNVTKPALSVSGNKYRCIITGTCGTATSDGTATLTVSKKALSVSATDKTKVYDGSIFPTSDYTVSYTGFVAGEDKANLSGTVSFTGTALTAVNAGPWVITPAGLLSDNYDISYLNGTLNITKKSLTVTAVNKTKEYDGSVFPVSTYSVTYNGFISGQDETVLTGTITFSGTAITAINSGTYVITPGGLTPVNYDFVYVNGSLNITKKALTATADDKSKFFGEPNPAFTISYSGFVAGDNSSSVTAPTAGTSAVAGSLPGTYPITLTGGTSDNYILSLVSGVLTVNKALLTARADDKVKPYGSANPALTISYTGFLNGDTPSNITEPSISTTSLTESSVGTYPITLSGGSAGDYTLVLVNGVLTVEKAVATVTLGNLATIYNGTARVVTATTSPAGLTVNLTYNGSATAPINAGTYPVVATINDGSYQGSASGNLVVSKASQTITFNDIPAGLRMTQEYQLVASASSGLDVTFVSSNPDRVSISGTTLTVNGDGTVTITCSQAGNDNWNAATSVIKTLVTLPTFDNISSLFTPNNDGMNDLWYIPGLEEYGTLRVTVYNRFGQAVFKSDSYHNDWDGTWNGNPLPSASYYYIMKSSAKGTIKGVVNIIR